jgi:hypothetical protein
MSGSSPRPQYAPVTRLLPAADHETLMRSAESLCTCYAEAARTRPNIAVVAIAECVLAWSTTVELYVCTDCDKPDRPRLAAAALYGLWHFLRAAHEHYYGKRDMAFRSVRNLQPFRLGDRHYPSAVDAALDYGEEILSTAQKAAAPAWQPLAHGAGSFPMDEFVANHLDIIKQFAAIQVFGDTVNLSAALELELARVERELGETLPTPAVSAAVIDKLLGECRAFLETDGRRGPDDPLPPTILSWQRVYRSAVTAAAPATLVEAVAFPAGVAGSLAAGMQLTETAKRLRLQGNVARLQAWGDEQLRLAASNPSSEPPAEGANATPSDPPGGWSEAKPPKQWAREFGVSVSTIKRRFNDARITAKKLSAKLYQVAVKDLPTSKKPSAK